MTKYLVIEPQYFGSIAYFGLLHSHVDIMMDVHSHYIKQTYRNRCHLLSPQGVKSLTIPVHYRNHMPIKDVRIDYQQTWIKIHLGLLMSAYGKSAYFEFYFPEISRILNKKFEFLIDLTLESMTTCLDWLQIDRSISLSEKYQQNFNSEKIDARDWVHPKKTSKLHDIFNEIPYYQNFGNNFVPNLSLLDSLFNCGPECIDIVRKSQKKS